MTESPYIPRRPRRLRASQPLRNMMRETHLAREHLVYPYFVVEGKDIATPIPSMPGIYQYSVDRLLEDVAIFASLGGHAVILFGVPKHKDKIASQAYHPESIVARAIRAIKKAHPTLLVIADVCLCEYMDHGHCGIVDKHGLVDNDATVPLLSQTALAYAKAGADIVAPSDMMDGRVAAIRAVLDDDGFSQVPIMSYAVKHASSLYGPFRDAALSPPQFGDRKGYQMDAANAREAYLEATLDFEEGADILMVKPALSALDLIRGLHERFDVPIAAYQVSGEYAMIKAAAEKGWLDERAVVFETLIAMRRAGAQIIITYYAKQVLAWMKELPI